MPTTPRILDSKGSQISIGDQVWVFPDTARPDVSRVTGFKQDWLGWRVEHSWLTGYHPDESAPSEPTEPTGDPNTYHCPDLSLVTTEETNLNG